MQWKVSVGVFVCFFVSLFRAQCWCSSGSTCLRAQILDSVPVPSGYSCSGRLVLSIILALLLLLMAYIMFVGVGYSGRCVAVTVIVVVRITLLLDTLLTYANLFSGNLCFHLH